MSKNFQKMCLELANEPKKLAQFIKLYYGDNKDNSNSSDSSDSSDSTSKSHYKKCITCKKSNNKDDFSKCKRGCNFNYLLLYKSWDVMNNFIKNPGAKTYNFYSIGELNKNISQDKIINIIKSDNIDLRGKFLKWFINLSNNSTTHIQNFTNELFFAYLHIEDIKYIIKENKLLAFISFFSLEKIKEKKLLGECIKLKFDSVNKLIEKIIDWDLDYFIVALRYSNEYIIRHFLTKIDIEKIKKEILLYNFIWDKKIFNLIYTDGEINDEMAKNILNQFKFPEFLHNYTFENPNILFNSLSKKILGDSYLIDVHITGKIFEFIDRHGEYPKTPITKETLENFFSTMYTPNYKFRYWLYLLLKNTPSENINLDFYFEANNIYTNQIEKFYYKDYFSAYWDILTYNKMNQLGFTLSPHNIFSLLDDIARPCNVNNRTKNSIDILTDYKKTNSLNKGLDLYSEYLTKNLPNFKITALDFLEKKGFGYTTN
jgi:hypothetical protein